MPTQTLQDRTPAPLAEPKPTPQPGERVIDDVFLSPRVLDRRAFELFAEELRGLIREAAGAKDGLLGAVGGTDTLRDTVREGAALMQQKIEQAGKLLPGLDARLKAAEALLSKATDNAALSASAQQKIEQAVAERVGEIEQTLGGRIAELEARARAAEQRYAGAVAKLESLADDADARTESEAERTATRIVERAGAALESLETKLGAAEGRAGEIQQRFEAQADAATDAIERTGSDVAEQLASVKTDAATAVSVFESRCAELAERLDTAAGPTAERIGVLLERVDAATGEHGLAGIVDRAERQTQALQATGRTVAQLAEQAERVRTLLAESVHTGAEQVDAAERRQAALAQRVREVEDRCRLADADSGELESRVRASCEPAMESIRERVEQASDWLNTLIARAHEAAQLVAMAADEQARAETGSAKPDSAERSDPSDEPALRYRAVRGES